MFGKVNKDAVDQNNSNLEDEINKTKPEAQPKKPIDKVNVAGNVLAVVGTSFQLVAGIGAGVLACVAISGLLGVSMLYTILILAGVGILLTLIGNKLMTESLLPPAFGV